MSGWHQYCCTDQNLQFVRFHPKTKKDEHLLENLDKVTSQVKKAIYIYPDPGSVLLTINNYYSKTWDDWWVTQFNNIIDQNKIYENWTISKEVPIEEIPTWIKREFLSLYLFPSWRDQVEWNHIDSWSDPKCYVVLVKDLMYNFEDTMKSIRDFCQLNFQRPIDSLTTSHQENIKLQKFINQDTICHNIVHSVLTDQPYQWAPLPLPSEAWVQWQLRHQGYEIQCHDLDQFPTDNVHLKNLMYSV